MRQPFHCIHLCLLILTSLLAHGLAVEFREVRHAGVRITVATVDLRKDDLQLFHRDENGVPFRRFTPLATWLGARQKRLTFAMNAGMYHGDFSAVGLSVGEGREWTPLNLARGEGNFFLQPNGIFLVGEQGARVIESSEYRHLRDKVRIATQSGPLLLRGGHIHPAFKPGSANRLFRNGVGVPSPWIVVFAISEAPINFYDFATCFRDVLGCPEALFLDGTISSLYAPELKRNDFRMDLGPILGVVTPQR